jgi:hypothetical protein
MLKHCAENRKRRLSALPNVGPYIYTTLKFLALQGTPYIYIYNISRLRVKIHNGSARSTIQRQTSLVGSKIKMPTGSVGCKIKTQSSSIGSKIKKQTSSIGSTVETQISSFG